MQVASPGAARKSPATAAGESAAAAARRLSLHERVVEALRQDYLDALPIAAAVIGVSASDEIYIDSANDHFSKLTRWDKRRHGSRSDQVEFLTTSTINDKISSFLHSDEVAHQFESHDGQVIGGRHFTVRLARLKPSATAVKRCLISLIDKTA